jgi:putative nucleotidyltransferase with HDIG domain
VAIDNTILVDELSQSNRELTEAYETTLEGWALALELRDRETEGHTRRVAALAVRLAERMGVDGPAIEHLRRGAILHDVGKMAVPDSILHKPGPLDEYEWTIMRRHPVHAVQMLNAIEYLRPALEIPHHHHERWDGSGYPQGLSGELIPLSARIFAVVDVWDALNSDRPYRPAWSRAEARNHLCQEAGVLFDPEVVAAFIELLDDEEAQRTEDVRSGARSPVTARPGRSRP